MYCAPLQIDTLGIQAIPYINAQPNDSISWQVINSSGITVATATGLDCPSHVITDQNDYVWIVITATNICGSDQDSLQIWTSEDPVADFDINTTQGCHPLTITTDTTINSSIGTYTWELWNISNNTLDSTVITNGVSTPVFTLNNIK